MSITTIASSDDLAAERWQQWQLRYAARAASPRREPGLCSPSL